jgi:hypothetical protein
VENVFAKVNYQQFTKKMNLYRDSVAGKTNGGCRKAQMVGKIFNSG